MGKGKDFTCEGTVGNGTVEINVTRTDDDGSMDWGITPLDIDKARSILPDTYEQKTGVELNTVTCPDQVPVGKGVAFTCTGVDANGVDITFDITQTDDQGNVDIEFNGPPPPQ